MCVSICVNSAAIEFRCSAGKRMAGRKTNLTEIEIKTMEYFGLKIIRKRQEHDFLNILEKGKTCLVCKYMRKFAHLIT